MAWAKELWRGGDSGLGFLQEKNEEGRKQDEKKGEQEAQINCYKTPTHTHSAPVQPRQRASSDDRVWPLDGHIESAVPYPAVEEDTFSGSALPPDWSTQLSRPHPEGAPSAAWGLFWETFSEFSFLLWGA